MYGSQCIVYHDSFDSISDIVFDNTTIVYVLIKCYVCPVLCLLIGFYFSYSDLV